MAKRLLDQRWPWLLASGVIALIFVGSFVDIHGWGDRDERPLGGVEDILALRERKDVNVLFILIDTLRADRLGAYGYARETSPRLDALANSGVRFVRHLSQSSWTKASMASLWTGLYPTRTGITRFDHVLPETARMPAEVLKEAGFETAGLWRNGWVAPTFGFDQGFNVYERPLPTPPAADVRLENPTLSEAGTDESAIESALEFLRIRGQKRWFLYLHLMDLHEYLYDEESALFGTRYSDIYDNSLRWTDGVIESLLASLGELGQLDRTIVVIASDHGEDFGERGFEGHARKVYKESTEVPLIISFPFRLDPGIAIETRTQNVDVWPTVLGLLGLELPGTDGRSRVPEILASARGEAAAGEEVTAIAELDQTWARPQDPPMPTVAVSQGTHRYVRTEQANGVVEQLFDSTGDPKELQDRAGEQPEALERLRAVAKEHSEQQPVWGAVPTREIGELELGQLRALGYAIP